jgi:hydroxyacylglutathione hydrolase
MIDSSNKYKKQNFFGNFYCYIWQGMGNNSNTYLFADVLEGEKRHVIIDPGIISSEFGENCFESLVSAIESDELRIEDIGLIINTHSHTDHCQSNELIVQRSNAEIALSEEDEQFRHTTGRKLDSMFGIRSPEFTTSLFLKEGDLKLGEKNGITLQVILVPGHSPGSICLYWPEHKALITGDVVFYGSVGRTDFPGGGTGQLKQSIDRLSELDVEYLFPGHSTEYGSIIEGKANVEHNFQAIKTFFY